MHGRGLIFSRSLRAASGFLGLDFGDLLSGGIIPKNMARGYYRNWQQCLLLKEKTEYQGRFRRAGCHGKSRTFYFLLFSSFPDIREHSRKIENTSRTRTAGECFLHCPRVLTRCFWLGINFCDFKEIAFYWIYWQHDFRGFLTAYRDVTHGNQCHSMRIASCPYVTESTATPSVYKGLRYFVLFLILPFSTTRTFQIKIINKILHVMF